MLDFAESLAPISRIGVVSFRDDLFSFYGKRGYVITSREPIANLIPIQFLQRTGTPICWSVFYIFIETLHGHPSFVLKQFGGTPSYNVLVNM